MIFNLNSPNSPFLNFSKLKNFIIYEQEQSCFKAPSNYVRIIPGSLPTSVINIYTDASVYRYYNSNNNKQDLDNLILPDFSSYVNLKKLILDINGNFYTDLVFFQTIDTYILYSIGSGSFINSPNIKIYSTFSFDFYEYNQLELFNETEFGQYNQNYNGYKIPYYFGYINPLKNRFNIQPSFQIPDDKNSDIYKVFALDKYYSEMLNQSFLQSTLLINSKLSSIAKINYHDFQQKMNS